MGPLWTGALEAASAHGVNLCTGYRAPGIGLPAARPRGVLKWSATPPAFTTHHCCRDNPKLQGNSPLSG